MWSGKAYSHVYSNIIVVIATMYTKNLHHQFSPPNNFGSHTPLIGIRSIDAKITQTTNPIVNNCDQDSRIMVNVILDYLPIALFLSNNHPEMYCTCLFLLLLKCSK